MESPQRLTANLFSELASATSEEVFERIASGGQTRIERIVSHGQASEPGFWYDQDEVEWVALLAGSATLEFRQKPPVVLRPGDHLLIQPHELHRVAMTSPHEPTIWLAVFFKP